MLDILAFHIFHISISCKNMGPNEFKNLTLFVKVAHISIFHTEFFSFFEDIHLEYQKKNRSCFTKKACPYKEWFSYQVWYQDFS